MSVESHYDDLKKSLIDCDPKKADEVARILLELKADPLYVIDKVLIPTMAEIGDKFDKMEIFLPELMVSAQAMQAATSVLMEPYKESSIERPKKKGKIVLGTVQGDIHEIGKNIVKIMLEVSGFEVFDLGNDVPSMKFIEKATEVNADVIALSALMTTTMISQKEVLELLEAIGKRKDYIVIIGGAPTTETWQKEIGADGWAETAVGASKLVAQLIQSKVK